MLSELDRGRIPSWPEQEKNVSDLREARYVFAVDVRDVQTGFAAIADMVTENPLSLDWHAMFSAQVDFAPRQILLVQDEREAVNQEYNSPALFEVRESWQEFSRSCNTKLIMRPLHTRRKAIFRR